MTKMARRALRVPLVVETAGRVAGMGASPGERARLIREWVDNHVHFTPDPYLVELLKSPEYMLRFILAEGVATGDCDDVALLTAALGMAVGIPARFVLLSFASGQPFRHVYTELGTPCEGWVEMDTTRPDQFPPGLRVVDSEIHEV